MLDDRMASRRPRPAPARKPRPRTVHLLAAARRHTRTAHALENAEDYTEAIADLTEQAGEARLVDLARRLGVSHVTAARTLARLQREGFVRTQPYRAIFLTERGAALARSARERHEVVVAFLRRLGVPEETAHADAEGLEHHVSPATLEAFRRAFRRA